jgi:hypothetical protein
VRLALSAVLLALGALSGIALAAMLNDRERTTVPAIKLGEREPAREAQRNRSRPAADSGRKPRRQRERGTGDRSNRDGSHARTPDSSGTPRTGAAPVSPQPARAGDSPSSARSPTPGGGNSAGDTGSRAPVGGDDDGGADAAPPEGGDDAGIDDVDIDG